MTFKDLYECLEPLGLGDLAQSMLECGLVDAVDGFRVLRTDVNTYVVLPILSGPIFPSHEQKETNLTRASSERSVTEAAPAAVVGPLGRGSDDDGDHPNWVG